MGTVLGHQERQAGRIRLATDRDRLAIVQMAVALHRFSGIPLPTDPAYFSIALNDILHSPVWRTFIVDEEGPCGLLMACLEVSIFSGHEIASERLLYIDPTARGRYFRPLREAFEGWARDSGAVACYMSSLPDGRTSQVFERIGYHLVQNHHMKVL